MKELKILEEYWLNALSDRYPLREIKNMFSYYLEDVLDINRLSLIGNDAFCINESDQIKMNIAVERLKSGEPYQYIVGFTWFNDLKIQVDNRVLIPRPETEELVHWILDNHSDDPKLVLDWCSGSGCIALALKSKRSNWEVSGFDWSEEAIALAQKNATQLELDVPFFRKDALNSQSDKKWNLIVSNPPYIPVNEQATMRENVVKFEPEMALFVPSADPLIFYKAIANFALTNLTENGQLYFEIHEDFASEMKEMLAKKGFAKIEIKTDLQGKNRMLKAILNR